MSSSIGMGVVGAGSIGIRGALEHLRLPDVQDRVTLAAVCDPVPGRAQAAADKYGVKRAYDTLEDLLQDDDVHAVTLCSPIGLHYEQGLKAVRAGKHVHFNKTMTVTAGEATQLIDEAKAQNVKLVASPGQMLRPTNQAIRRFIQDGGLGRLSWAATGAAFGNFHEQERLRTGNDVLTTVNPSWYWRKPGGGPLYDVTVYGLHTMTGILGPARRVTAMSGVAIKEREYQGKMYPCDADDNTLITLDFGDAFFGFVHGTFAGTLTPWSQATIFGSKGSLIGDVLNGKQFEYPGRDEVQKLGGDIAALPHVVGPHREMEEAHVYEDIMQLVDLAREGTPTLATAEHARHVIEIFEAALRSSETGQTQTLTTTFPLLDAA